MTSLSETLDRFSDLVGEPRIPKHERMQWVPGQCAQLSRQTLAESARIIRENPELARQMGVSEEDIAAAKRARS